MLMHLRGRRVYSPPGFSLSGKSGGDSLVSMMTLLNTSVCVSSVFKTTFISMLPWSPLRLTSAVDTEIDTGRKSSLTDCLTCVYYKGALAPSSLS